MSWMRIRAIFFRYFYVIRKGPQQLSDLFYFPLVDILLWGLTSIWVQKASSEPFVPLFLMTGLIFYQISWRGSIDISVSFLQESWDRNLVNLFSTPLKISEWISGVILFSLSKLTLTLTFGATMVYILYTLNVFSVGWFFLPFAALLILFGWTVGFLAASALVYWGKAVDAIPWMIGMLFAPFSAVFYPVSVLPAWAQKISWALPTTYIFEGMRSILKTGTFPLSYFFTSLGLGLVYFGLSVTLFYTMFEISRKKGLGRIG